MDARRYAAVVGLLICAALGFAFVRIEQPLWAVWPLALSLPLTGQILSKDVHDEEDEKHG
jgi:hypothetical protein